MDFVLGIAVTSIFLISIVFSMFGQGGGLLYTPTLVLLGYTALVSVSTSLVLNLVTALFATVVFYRQKLVDLRLALALIPGISAGAFLGGALGNFVDSTLLLWLFVAVLFGAGARMVYTHWERVPSEEKAPNRPSLLMYAVIVIFSLGLGVLSGLLGIGGGVLIVPFLLFAYKVPTKTSVGTSGFVVIFSSLFGVLGHSAFGHLDATLILATLAAVAVGAFLGARLMVRTKADWVKVGFGLLMWVFALQLIAKLVGLF